MSERLTVRLIPRMREWVDQYYPGTRLALTEYNWGACGHINGALAQADVLGIFGREGLDLASFWNRIVREADLPAGTTSAAFPARSITLLVFAPAGGVTPRPGDIDGDGAVTLRDVGLLAASYNLSAGQPGYDARADLTGDGAVTLADFGLLAANFNRA